KMEKTERKRKEERVWKREKKKNRERDNCDEDSGVRGSAENLAFEEETKQAPARGESSQGLR
ncbi:MAG: hypothetical protein V4719_21995, partial [Planctomycetota bacterium]